MGQREDISKINILQKRWRADRERCKNLTLKVVKGMSQKGLTCREIAKRIGISWQYVGKLLREG